MPEENLPFFSLLAFSIYTQREKQLGQKKKGEPKNDVEKVVAHTLFDWAQQPISSRFLQVFNESACFFFFFFYFPFVSEFFFKTEIVQRLKRESLV